MDVEGGAVSGGACDPSPAACVRDDATTGTYFGIEGGDFISTPAHPALSDPEPSSERVFRDPVYPLRNGTRLPLDNCMWDTTNYAKWSCGKRAADAFCQKPKATIVSPLHGAL